MRTPALVLVSVAGIAALAIACGGGGDDEDFSDIVGSATAASSRSPAAGSSDEASPSPSASATTPATAEETATPVPTASATEATATSNTGGGDPATYSANVRAGADELKANVTTLKNEMFSAQMNQTEEAGEELKRQIALVNANIATLRGYTAPDSLSSFAADLEVALKKLESGTAALTRAVDAEDQLAGLEAFTAFNEGEALLDSAMSDLP